jgi:transcriptional regulator with XRE-family HTH domain
MTPEQRYQYNKIIDTLIKQRKDQGLTIEKLAMEIGTDSKTLGDWERKNKEPRLFNLLCWCEALQVYLTAQLTDGEF